MENLLEVIDTIPVQTEPTTVTMYVRCLDMNGNFLKKDNYHGTYSVGTLLKNVPAPTIRSYTPKETYKTITVQAYNNVITFTYKNVSLPILQYHCIGDPVANNINNSVLYVTVNNFRQQMQYLKSKGYTSLDFS